jgi:hypothetical protein
MSRVPCRAVSRQKIRILLITIFYNKTKNEKNNIYSLVIGVCIADDGSEFA